MSEVPLYRAFRRRREKREREVLPRARSTRPIYWLMQIYLLAHTHIGSYKYKSVDCGGAYRAFRRKQRPHRSLQ